MASGDLAEAGGGPGRKWMEKNSQPKTSAKNTSMAIENRVEREENNLLGMGVWSIVNLLLKRHLV